MIVIQKTTESLWQHFRDKPAINDANGEIVSFNVANAITHSFWFKQKIISETETMV